MLKDKKRGGHDEHSWIVPACRDFAHEAVVPSLGPSLVSRRTRRSPQEGCVVVL